MLIYLYNLYWQLLPQLQSEVLCSLVCVLSSVPALYCQAVQQLISTVVECAKMLSRSTQGLYIESSNCEVLSSYIHNFPSSDVSLLDVDSVERVAAVLKTLEALLTKYDTSILPQESKFT